MLDIIMHFITGVTVGCFLYEFLTRREEKQEEKQEQQEKEADIVKKIYTKNLEKPYKPFTIKDRPTDVLPKIDEEVEVVK